MQGGIRMNKWIRKPIVFLLAVTIGAGGVLCYQMVQKEEPTSTMKLPQTKQDSVAIIEKKAIMGTIKEKAELVSLKGELTKTMTFKQTVKPLHVDQHEFVLIRSVKEKINEEKTRRYEVKADVTYKLGIDLAALTSERVKVNEEKGTVHLVLPSPILVSFEMPYYNIQERKEDGLFVAPFTKEDEKQMIFQTEKQSKKELMANEKLRKKTITQAEQTIEDLLRTAFPKIKSITFETETK